MKRMLTVAALMLAACPASASWSLADYDQPFVSRNDNGGRIDQYEKDIERLRKTGRPVQVSGHCWSACTLLTALPDGQVCARPGAVLGFHSAWEWNRHGHVAYSRGGTQEMWSRFPDYVRSQVRSRGWDGLSPHPNLVVIPARFILPACA